MNNTFETKFTAWAFIIGAVLLWSGWAFTSHHHGEYLVATDFQEIGKDVWYWIWMYRLHIFGWVGMAIALFALTSLTMRKPMRVMMLPGIGMTIVGTFTLAIAAAFYYNFGAWGVGQTMDKSPAEIQAFIDNILPTNQYVTCFLRFGRIFSGVGLVIMGIGFVKFEVLPAWLGWFTTLLGLAAVGIIIAIPDNYEIYKPVFHIKVLWLITMGVVIMTKGINLSQKEE